MKVEGMSSEEWGELRSIIADPDEGFEQAIDFARDRNGRRRLEVEAYIVSHYRWEPCPLCDGKGHWEVPPQPPEGDTEIDCPECCCGYVSAEQAQELREEMQPAHP